MSYIGNSPGVASQRVLSSFTATSGQTVFTPSAGYTLGYLDVYQNGVKLIVADDYTASDGVTFTLTAGAASGDSVECVAYFPRGLSDGYLKAEADAKYVDLTNAQTIAGVKTFSSDPILSAGTVNGVVYLNSSKAETSGSNLTFNGTTLTANTIGAFTLSGTVSGGGNNINNVVIGASTPLAGAFTTLAANGVTSTKTNINSSFLSGDATTRSYLVFGRATQDFLLGAPGSGGGTLVPGDVAGDAALSINTGRFLISYDGGATTKFVASSTGLAVTGTLSATLDAAIGQATSSFPSGGGMEIYNATAPRLKLTNSTTGTASTDGTHLLVSGSDFYIQQREAASVIIATNGSDRVTVNSSGNLGLGVTPSAWLTSFRAMQLGQGSSLWGAATGNNAAFDSNVYVNTSGSSIYVGSTFATRYQQSDGAHMWSTAPSGTAGNAITFTQAMTLDASGNLGIGYTSPQARLDVRASNIAIGVTALATAQGQAFVGTTTGWGQDIGGTLALGGAQNSSTLTQTFASISGRRESSLGYIYTGYLQLAVSDGANMVERARIDSSGNLLVGTTSATVADSGADNLIVGPGTGNNGITVYSSNTGNGNLNFADTDSTTVGLIQYQHAGNNMNFRTNSAEAMRINSSGNLLVGTITYAGDGVSIADADNNGGCYSGSGTTALRNHWRFGNTNGVVGSIQTSASLTLYNTTSDYRLKTVIGAVSGSGSRIDALQPVEYTWNVNGERTRGFLAHEFQEVYASSVSGDKDAVDENGNPVYQAMQASTSEVIADIVAELQSLRKRITALEAR